MPSTMLPITAHMAQRRIGLDSVRLNLPNCHAEGRGFASVLDTELRSGEEKAHPQSGEPSLLYLPLAAGDWIVGARAGAMTGGMTLGATVVRSLAAVAGTEVRVAKGR